MMRDIKGSSEDKRAKVWRSYSVPSNWSVEKKQQFNEAIAEGEAALKLERLARLRLLTYRFYSVCYEKYYD